ncbi:hypothetical protein V8G56_13455 [Gaetbulibacter aquiaggeris]|uniref:GWxTD domain-containing protein n=1 Tax=Gaetbulibacter aquiaggeris TaxID=1735373 RepID=A0ABW7MSW8_9FLAO
MKKLLLTFVTLFLFVFTSHSQMIMVVSEIETTDVSAYEDILNRWMSSLKKVTETESAQMRVHQVDGSRELIATRFYGSLQEMADTRKNEKEKEEQIAEEFRSMPGQLEGSWDQFLSSTDFKNSSVWEFVSEGSTLPRSWESMTQEERDQLLYRRVQYFSVDLMQGDAFEAWWKKASEADAKLGINYHVAMFKSVFGGNDADYMIILIDKTRFDYYNHWEDRMKTRMASEEFKTLMSGSDNSKWSVIKESNWIRLPKMTH